MAVYPECKIAGMQALFPNDSAVEDHICHKMKIVDAKKAMEEANLDL